MFYKMNNTICILFCIITLFWPKYVNSNEIYNYTKTMLSHHLIQGINNIKPLTAYLSFIKVIVNKITSLYSWTWCIRPKNEMQIDGMLNIIQRKKQTGFICMFYILRLGSYTVIKCTWNTSYPSRKQTGKTQT